MNRRIAMLLTTLLGGVLPRGCSARSPARRTSSTGRRPGRTTLEPATNHADRRRRARRRAARRATPTATTRPPNFPPRPGSSGRTFDIAEYTGLDHSQATTRRTPSSTGSSGGPARPPGTATRSPSSAPAGRRSGPITTPRSSTRSAEVVERFTNAQSDFLSVRVRFVAAVDTRWRYAVYSRLTPVGSGPQGQQIWTLKVEDAAFVLAQMQVYQGFRLLTDQKVDMVNGQTLTVQDLRASRLHRRHPARERGGPRVPAEGRAARGRRDPPAQPAPDLRRRRPRRRHRADREHRQEPAPDPGHRPSRDRPGRDDARRARGVRDRGSTRRSRTGRSGRPC